MLSILILKADLVGVIVILIDSHMKYKNNVYIYREILIN